jgi:hypothetical protein
MRPKARRAQADERRGPGRRHQLAEHGLDGHGRESEEHTGHLGSDRTERRKGSGSEEHTGHCVAHGGGRRCQTEGCTKSAVGGGRPHCIAYGGGRRCQTEDCTKAAQGITGREKTLVLLGGAR